MVLIPFFFALAAAGSGTASHLAVEDCDVGEIYAFNSAECEIALSNSGDKPINLHDIRVVSEGDHAEQKGLVVPPSAQAHLKIRFNSGNGIGSIRHEVHFRTDEQGHEERSASVTAFAITLLDQPNPKLDLGIIRVGNSAPIRKSIELVSHDVADLRITKIVEAPVWLDASIGADGHTLAAAAKADASWGVHTEFLKAAINAPQQKEVWVEVTADIRGEVVPDHNPYDLGSMRVGSEHEVHIPLHSRSGRDFQVGKVELEGFRGTTSFDTCEKPSGNCHMLILRVADRPPGPIKGSARIELPDLKQRLNISIFGVFVPTDEKVKTPPGEATAKSDIQRAAENKAHGANREPPPGKGPLLKWTVANGQPIYGFQIFRAGAEAGPFVLVNAKTIASIAKTKDSIDYRFRDNSAESGKTYWYYIGIVYNDGRKQKLSDSQKVVAR
jgi:hypothetical protein